jgi:hypothetical protein
MENTPQFTRLSAAIPMMISLLTGASIAPAALITVTDSPIGTTPDVLAYNLAHFFPGSNAADWWRYSRVSGARLFLAPSHFNVAGTVRPGEQAVVDQASFLERRAALRADPLNTDFINWPIVEGRFNVALTGNNRIVPQYAFEEIHRRGGTIKAQMTLGEGSFPIANEADWAGKWVAWRTFYSVAFYLAREFDVERFASHNEPNHPASFIEVAPWLMRLRLAADAVQAAISDVNARYGKSLQPRFKAPVTAGATGSGLDDYGLPAVSSINRDFLGNQPPGFQLFHHYAFQSYSSDLASMSSAYATIRTRIDAALPPGIAPLRIATTEFNVHTGANYDTMPESSDTLSKAVRFGAQVSRYAALGVDELFAFKFGMTRYSNNFPVQKNGMLFTDNTHAPHNYGTMSRSAEVYRLFNKGFGPGRQLLAHSVSGTGAASLELLVAYDPPSRTYTLFSVNESGSAIPLEIDLRALAVPDGNLAVIEDVSEWRTGLVRSMEQVRDGLLLPGSQPNRSVWLITVPADPQRVEAGDSTIHAVPVSSEVMVRDGAFADQNFGADLTAVARNDATSADGRSAVFLQFDLPPDWNPNDLLVALLAVPIAPASGGSAAVHAHLYGIDDHAWSEHSITWRDAPNLRQNAPPGDQIRHGVVADAGTSAHILGQLTAAGPVTRQVDVTDYLVRQQAGKASFLIAQDPRWDVDIRVNSVPASWLDLTQGDSQPDGLALITSRSSGDPAAAAQLLLIRRAQPTVGFTAWIRSFFGDELIIADTFDLADGPLAGQGNWARGPSSPTSDNPSNHLVVANGAVLFDWTTSLPVNNLVRLLWPVEQSVVADWVYASFDLHVSTPPQPASGARPAFFSFGDGSGNQQRGFVGLRAGSVPNSFQLGIASRSQLGDSFSFAPVNLAANTRHSVTVGFHAGTEDTVLWINAPHIAASPSVMVAGTGTNSGMRRVNLRLYNSDGDTATTNLGVFSLDNLRVSAVDPSRIDPAANPAGDGLSNLLKFALGIDPRHPAGDKAPRIIRTPDGLALHHTRNAQASGVQLVVESSSNLSGWAPYAGSPQTVVPGATEVIRIPLPADPAPPGLFLRLRPTMTGQDP